MNPPLPPVGPGGRFVAAAGDFFGDPLFTAIVIAGILAVLALL